jgi:hypothetical protein
VLSKRPGAVETIPADHDYRLIVRANADFDLEKNVGPIIDRYVAHRRIATLRTVKQGACLDSCFSVALREGESPQELIRTLNRIEGVQEVKLLHRDVDEEPSK